MYMHASPVTRFATLELPTVLGLLSSPSVRLGSSPHNLYSLAASYIDLGETVGATPLSPEGGVEGTTSPLTQVWVP